MHHDVGQLPDVKAARELAEIALAHGWRFGFVTAVDNGDSPFFHLHVAHPDLAPYYKICWHTRNTGSYRLFSKLVREQVGGLWKDAPSLKEIKDVISRNSAQE